MEKFVIHLHEAIRKGTHFDLRFSIPDSRNWASFVFNKFPPLEPGERVYIPRAPDHNLENALFTGEIKSGYGAGSLKKVDGGSCDVIKYTNAHIVVNFKGKKLQGIYHFINAGVFGRRRQYNKKVYAFFKGKIESN